MSCEHFAIFFPNLPFMSYIRQNYSISKKQQKTAFLKKVLSIKLPDSHFRDHWGFPMQRRLMGKKLGFLHYSSLLLWFKPQVSNLWYKIPVWQNNYIHTYHEDLWAICANKMIISHCVRNSFFHKLYCILYMYQSNVQFTAQNAFSCAHRLHNIMK